MIDVDNADIGIVALAAIAIAAIASAVWSLVTFAEVKEVILVCVAAIGGVMGKDRIKKKE